MNYEKAYKAVLKTAQQWIKDGCSDKEKVCLESVFPELRESEDEKMRKAILAAIRHGLNTEEALAKYNVTYDDVEAWLEKQKEPHFTKRNALFDKCVENCDPKTVEEVNKRVDDIMNMPELSAFEQALTNFIGYWEDDEERWPSKFVKKHGKHILDMAREELQKEQKIPDCCLKCNEYEIGYKAGYKHGCTAGYNKAMKEVDEQKEQKPAEKQDYSGLNDLERAIHRGFLSAGVENVPVTIIKETANECKWTQTIANENANAEWSEEEKLHYTNVLEALEYVKGCKSDYDKIEAVKSDIAWFKSLRPQSRWKPSEEQMEAFKGYIEDFQARAEAAVGGWNNFDVMIRLYEQLKKL